MVSTRELIDFATATLDATRFRDAAINGLQVGGREHVSRLATSVSVSEQIVRQAIDWRADMLLVHHGLFWGERSGPITGPLRTRLRLLLQHDISLVGYHLPLDAHPQLGNNALLAKHLGLNLKLPFAEIAGQSIGFVATPDDTLTLDDLVARVRDVTGRDPTLLRGGVPNVDQVAILSGSGYSALDEAAKLGCQVLITGDVREPTMALAREIGISVIAGGHEATERLGIQELGALLAAKYGLETTFFIDQNPI